jgi:hypothetical protein
MIVSTTFQTIYTIPFTGTNQGFITVVGSGGTTSGMIMAFFSASFGNAYANLTPLAVTGNAAQGPTNLPATSSGGSQTLFLQLSGNYIQVKGATACTVAWYITLI